MKRRKKKLLGMIIALTLVASACSGSDKTALSIEDVAGPVESMQAESTTTTEAKILPEFAEATRPSVGFPDTYRPDLGELVDRYLLYQEAIIYAGSAPMADPDDSTLAELTSGEQLVADKERLQKLNDEGHIYSLPETTVSSSRVVPGRGNFERTEGNVFFLKDCLVDDVEVIRLSDGEVIKKGTSTRLETIRMMFSDGSWKVDQVGTMREYEGESDCSGDL